MPHPIVRRSKRRTSRKRGCSAAPCKHLPRRPASPAGLSFFSGPCRPVHRLGHRRAKVTPSEQSRRVGLKYSVFANLLENLLERVVFVDEVGRAQVAPSILANYIGAPDYQQTTVGATLNSRRLKSRITNHPVHPTLALPGGRQVDNSPRGKIKHPRFETLSAATPNLNSVVTGEIGGCDAASLNCVRNILTLGLSMITFGAGPFHSSVVAKSSKLGAVAFLPAFAEQHAGTSRPRVIAII